MTTYPMKGAQIERIPDQTPWMSTLHDVAVEVMRARDLHPGNVNLFLALVEEVGELAKNLLEGKPFNMVVEEAKHVACVAIRIMEEGDSNYKEVKEHG